MSNEGSMAMWTKVKAASRQSRATNEDAYAVSTNALVLADGATGMGEQKMTGWGTDASWLSHRLADLLAQRLENQHLTVDHAMTDVLGFLRREYETATGQPLSDDPVERPSAAVIVARLVADTLELVTLGDCTAVVALRDGRSLTFHDDTVTRRDDRIIDLAMSRARAAGKPPWRQGRWSGRRCLPPAGR